MKQRHVVFELNNDYCALDIQDILEITALETMVKTRSTELNVILWEEKSLPVIDPFAMLTLNDHKPKVQSRIAVVEREGNKFGILFDSMVGTVDVVMEDVVEPMLNEPRYVSGVYDEKIKLFTPEALLTKKVLDNFDAVYKLQLHHLEEGIKVHAEKMLGRDDIKEDVRLRALNWLVKGTRSGIDESFLDEAVQIHNLVSKM